MKAYKGFDKNLKCRDFQYEIGGEYTEEEARLCESGFHACEYPLDVFSYYHPADSRFCEVEMDGVSDKRGEDSKVCAKHIQVSAEIGIAGIAKASVEYIKTKISGAPATNTGDRSAATNTGDWSVATNTGNRSAAEVSGRDSVAIATGFSPKVRGGVGCAIVCAERGEWDGEKYPLLAICSAIVDGEKIKADTWYTVKNGEFVEVDENDD